MNKSIVTQFDFFKNIAPDALEPILKESEIERYAPDTVIIQQGKSQNWFFFILEGQVEIYLEENDHTHLAYLGEGDYFGEMSALTGDLASASVMAMGNASILKMPRNVFLQLIKICPELNSKLIQALLTRLKQTNDGISEAFRKELAFCNYYNQERKSCYGKYIASSPVMEEVNRQIVEQSAIDTPLLILGEPGVGKEQTAANIHYKSKRANRPFVVVNCLTLTKSNWENNLLGSQKNNGNIALAEGGSILFKNIEALPEGAKSLFNQLITDNLRRRQVRVMASSQKTREELQLFLEDQIWRQLVCKALIIPPLRERKNDIASLARNFLIKHSRETGHNIFLISPEAMKLLNSYSYLTANVKELEEIIARAVLNTKNDCLEPDTLQFGMNFSLKDERPKIGLALSGGGARGLAHVGVLDVLEQEQIEIDYIAGTSIGAIVGALYAAGISTTEMKKIMGKISWRQLVSFTFPSGGLLKTDGIGAFINKVLGQKTFDQLQKPFAVVATDANTGEEVIIREGLVAPAVRASATLPGIFKPICIDGRYFLDGGLVNNVPANVVRSMGANFVIAVDLGGMGEQIPRGVLQMLLQAFAILIQRNEATALEWSDIIIKPKLGKYNLADLKLWREIMEQGRIAALQAIPELRDKLKMIRNLAI